MFSFPVRLSWLFYTLMITLSKDFASTFLPLHLPIFFNLSLFISLHTCDIYTRLFQHSTSDFSVHLILNTFVNSIQKWVSVVIFHWKLSPTFFLNSSTHWFSHSLHTIIISIFITIIFIVLFIIQLVSSTSSTYHQHYLD